MEFPGEWHSILQEIRPVLAVYSTNRQQRGKNVKHSILGLPAESQCLWAENGLWGIVKPRLKGRRSLQAEARTTSDSLKVPATFGPRGNFTNATKARKESIFLLYTYFHLRQGKSRLPGITDNKTWCKKNIPELTLVKILFNCIYIPLYCIINNTTCISFLGSTLEPR